MAGLGAGLPGSTGVHASIWAIWGCVQGLPRENPGSRWPKTSLGALKDGARLTPEQLQTLNAICK